MTPMKTFATYMETFKYVRRSAELLYFHKIQRPYIIFNLHNEQFGIYMIIILHLSFHNQQDYIP